jgi:hypothetical protein
MRASGGEDADADLELARKLHELWEAGEKRQLEREVADAATSPGRPTG